MPVTDILAKIVGGSVGDAVDKIVKAFKADPTVVAQNKEKIDEITLELQGKLQDALSNEVTQSAEIIKAEAGSQSWLPRNVRPLLLLLWGLAITFNVLVPIIARYWIPSIQPLPLDPWVYKLTVIGYTGYVSWRSVEKLMDKDN